MPDYQATSTAFTHIYDNKIWGEGSGASAPDLTRPYMKMLTDFIHNNRVKSVVDVGCGDWQFSRAMDWSGVRYYGFDVVASVIEANGRQFASDTVTFHLLSEMANLPSADLVVCKDVLQHLPIADIQEHLDWFCTRYKYAIVTNDIYPDESTNIDIEVGSCRALRLDLEPFNRRVATLVQWEIVVAPNRWIKSSCLLLGYEAVHAVEQRLSDAAAANHCAAAPSADGNRTADDAQTIRDGEAAADDRSVSPSTNGIGSLAEQQRNARRGWWARWIATRQ